MGTERFVQALAQPIEFEVSDERKQDDANEKSIGDIGGDGVPFRPPGQGPKSLEWGADEKADR